MRNEGKNRKIAIVVHRVKLEDVNKLDADFWLKKSVSERLAEVCRLRRLYFSRGEEGYPSRIAKVVNKRIL